MDIKWHSHGDWARRGKEDPGEDWTDDSSQSDSDGRLSVCVVSRFMMERERNGGDGYVQGNRFKPESRKSRKSNRRENDETTFYLH